MCLLQAGKILPKVFVVVMLLQFVVLAQKEERLIDKESWPFEPIKIVRLKNNKYTRIELGKSLEQEDDWLTGLTVTVQNASNKAIARMVLELGFPRAEGPSSDQPTYVVDMIYGRDPADSTTEVLELVQPNERAEIRLPEANLPLMKADLKTLGYTGHILRARIKIGSVTFVDGSMWSAGELFYPDPQNPKRKLNPRVPLNRQESERSPPRRSQLLLRTSLLRFQHVSFEYARAPYRLDLVDALLGRVPSADSPTVPCTTVFNFTETHNCGSDGSGCTYTQNNFSDGIEFLGIRNARKELSTVRCQKADGTFVQAA
jgi:hypothetical protein